MLKLKIKNRFEAIIFISSLFITTIWINFYYISSRNVDFNKYYDYINYFLGAEVKINYGQGSLYYFFVSKLFETKLDLVDERNLEIILSNSIQNINLLFYMFGLVGIFKYFKIYNFESNIILLSLTVFNFFPQSMYLRSVMKPEIVAFAFFPWILYFFELFRKTFNLKYLYSSLPFMLLVFSSKASIAGMIAIYLLIFNFDLIKKIDLKQLIILLLVFLLILFIIHYENYNITSNNFFEREYDENYDNKAPFDIIFKINFKSIFTSPFFDYEYQINKYSIHANSVFNIVILDTFGDFFNQLYDFNLNYFSQNRKDLFTTEGENLLSKNRVILYSGPLGSIFENNLNFVRKSISSLLSLLFFIVLFLFLFLDKRNRKIYCMPVIGIFTLYFNSLGFPSPNFNPFLGDTFKTFYYSFLISITFIFLVIKLFKKFEKLRLVFLFLWIALVFFIAGHPKSIDQEFSEYLVTSNEYSSFCEINNFLFFENELIKKFHATGNTNNITTNCSSNLLLDSPVNYFGTGGEKCIVNNAIDNNLSSDTNCRYSIVSFLRFDGNKGNSNIYPYSSIATFFFVLFIFLLELKYSNKFAKLGKD